MSYLLDCLGRGLLATIQAAFERQLPSNEDGIDTLAERFAASPASADLALCLGTAYLQAHRLHEARQAFEQARALLPSSSLPAIGMACVFDALGDYQRTIHHLAAAQACDPQDPAIPFAIGFCQEREGETEGAIANYNVAIGLCPQLRNAYERLAAIAVRQGDWDEAIRNYRQLLDLEPGDLEVLLTLANLTLHTDEPENAIEQYQRALLIDPDPSQDPLPAADEIETEQKLRETIATLEKLVKKYPGMPVFNVHLGDLYAKIGEDQQAVSQYQCALENHPDFLEATVKLGTQHLRQERYVDAAQFFNKAVELNDRLMTAFVGLGVSQHAAGRECEALASLDLAASLEPSTTLLFAEAARLQLKAQDEDGFRAGDMGDLHVTLDDGDDLIYEAIRRHRQALTTAPNHADLHYRLGLLLRQVGEYEDAIAAFENATAINPSYHRAMVKLGICLKEAGRTDDAIRVFRQALSHNQRYVDIHYQLGLLFAQGEQFELAVEEFEQAVAGNDRNISFRANLALALQNIGMIDRAAATWRSICELTRRPLDLVTDPEQRISSSEPWE